jgi:apolipoprotein N-acyltransferase
VPWFASASALVGQFGLGFVMAWASLAVFEAVRVRLVVSSRRQSATAEAVCALAVVGVLTGFGGYRQRAALDIDRTLDVVLLQTNIGDPIGLVDSGDPIVVLDSLVSLYDAWTREALGDSAADCVVWPETAVPAGAHHGVYYQVQRLAIETNTPVIFGGYDFQRTDAGAWQIYNTLYWIDTAGTIRDRYHKSMLIPIGEAIPFESKFPQLRTLLPNAGEFHAGTGPAVMHVNGMAMAPLICYELIFPHYVRQSLQRGGEILLNVSNDYWFGRSVEPKQHLALARMRAYETGRPIIRCTNTGISALIDSRGKLQQQTAIWKRQALRGTIDVPRMEWTPYARWGEWTTLVLVVFLCVLTWGMARLPRFRS